MFISKLPSWSKFKENQSKFENNKMDVINEIKSDDQKAWYNRGISQSRQGKFDDAVASYDKAIEIRPDRYEFWTGRAWSLYKIKKYKESDKNYDRVLELKPDYQLAKDNQKIVKKKLSKHKTYSFE